LAIQTISVTRNRASSELTIMSSPMCASHRRYARRMQTLCLRSNARHRRDFFRAP
jgi:hypothetical protein